MSYLEAYHAWLNSPALSAAEKAELASIQGDDKEIESRFFDQLSFGTAGLRGTMGVGLYRMNVHVIRHATQAFAQVILEEGPQAAARGVAVCFDCRNNSDVFARRPPVVMAATASPCAQFESLRPPGAVLRSGRRLHRWYFNVTASHNPKEHKRLQGLLVDAQLPPSTLTRWARKILDSLAPSYIHGLTLLGGEPMEPVNQGALADLTDRVRAAYPDKTIWCYTGDVYEELLDGPRHTADTDRLLGNIDILVDGPFVEEQKDITLRFRGSANQRIIDMNRTRAAGHAVLWEDDPIFATHSMEPTSHR